MSKLALVILAILMVGLTACGPDWLPPPTPVVTPTPATTPTPVVYQWYYSKTVVTQTTGPSGSITVSEYWTSTAPWGWLPPPTPRGMLQ